MGFCMKRRGVSLGILVMIVVMSTMLRHGAAMSVEKSNSTSSLCNGLGDECLIADMGMGMDIEFLMESEISLRLLKGQPPPKPKTPKSGDKNHAAGCGRVVRGKPYRPCSPDANHGKQRTCKGIYRCDRRISG